jgi:hypothetical protein
VVFHPHIDATRRKHLSAFMERGYFDQREEKREKTSTLKIGVGYRCMFGIMVIHPCWVFSDSPKRTIRREGLYVNTPNSVNGDAIHGKKKLRLV